MHDPRPAHTHPTSILGVHAPILGVHAQCREPTSPPCKPACRGQALTWLTSAPASRSALTAAVFWTPAPSITARMSGVSPYLSGVLTSAPAAEASAGRGGDTRHRGGGQEGQSVGPRA
eukprot:scaffold10647_cov113-Isochrysis_galbana.AAC.15